MTGLNAADRKRREEHVKLAASALANLGTAFIVGGAVGPSLLGHVNVLILGAAIATGLGFHAGAHLVLHYVVADVYPEAPK